MRRCHDLLSGSIVLTDAVVPLIALSSLPRSEGSSSLPCLNTLIPPLPLCNSLRISKEAFELDCGIVQFLFDNAKLCVLPICERLVLVLERHASLFQRCLSCYFLFEGFNQLLNTLLCCFLNTYCCFGNS